MKNKKNMCRLLSCILIIILVVSSGCAGKTVKPDRMHYEKTFTIGNNDISEYEIVCRGRRTYKIAKTIQNRIELLTGDVLPIKYQWFETDAPNILVWIYKDRTDEGADYHITDSEISFEGNANIFVSPKVDEFFNTYCDFMFSGNTNEAVVKTDKDIVLPENLEDNVKNAWINKREATICLWKPNFTRGTVYNASTSNKTDILSYSDEQIYDYVKMLKFCGFTGIQVTEMCSAWSGVSGYEFVSQQLKKIADSAHSLGMDFTLWVWASEFNNFSWVDESACYEPELDEGFAYENPAVISTFNKYYDIYAELSDCCDRVICHFYDPGKLTKTEDIAFFANMLREKMIKINPKIDFGVSCWGTYFDAAKLVELMGNDITIYEGDLDSPYSDKASFRQNAAEWGTRLGTWSWGHAEMETDQLAQMNFNAGYLQNIYQTMQSLDEINKSTYWSEMDAYHVLNVFSLYMAGHLLQDPNADLDELENDIAKAVVGNDNAANFVRCLKLLEKARTGNSYDTFYWDGEDYILKSDNYPAEEILEECAICIPFIEELINSNVESGNLPLPISLTDLMKLVLPHFKQIEQFAKFRKEFAKLKENVINGSDLLYAENCLYEIAKPIPEYNATIGLWGQIEARAQREMVIEFCEEYDLQIPIYKEFDAIRKNRIVSAFQSEQLGKEQPVLQYTYQYGAAYGKETDRLLNELVTSGVLNRFEENPGFVYLANWSDYIYNFN